MFRGFFSALHGSGCRHQRLAVARRDGGSQTRWRQPAVMEAGSKEVGDFAIWQNLRLLLTPEEAGSPAVQSQPSAKNATDNHLSVTNLLNPSEAGSPAVESHPVGCKYLSGALNQLRPSI